MRPLPSFLLTLFLATLLPAQPAGPALVPAPESRTAPRGVTSRPDLPYAGTDNPRQRLDLFLPEHPAADKLPVIVFIHGGAWRQGDRRGGAGMVVPYVTGGNFAGISVGYRLSQEAVWPAQIHDCKAAVRWIRAHAAEHHLDPDRIIVWGSSAGGQLVSMLGTTAGIPELDGSIGPHVSFSTRVAGVIDYFGPSDLLQMQAQSKAGGLMDHDAPDSPESQLVGGPLRENKAKAASASPLTHVSKGDAPFLIVHGDADPLVPHRQSELLLVALLQAGVPAELHTVKGGGHGGFKDPAVKDKTAAFVEKIRTGPSAKEVK